MDPAAEKKRVCVTGAGGFIASWLVKLLLSKGYVVHGTVRDPSDPKNSHLKELHPTATENLQLFKADLLDYESVASAITGCEGVFHVASPVFLARVPNPETEVIEPAVTGTLNVLKACSEAKVKRVVVVSSIAAVAVSPDAKDKILDEDAWSDAEYCRKIETWYCLSKTLAEREALNYGEKHGLNVVTVCPSYAIGPLLQPTLNASSMVLINMLNGTHNSMENILYYFVDVRDVADALYLVYKNPEASGRYICGPCEVKLSDLIHMLRSLYPNYKYSEKFTEAKSFTVHSEKLEKLGWRYRTLKESLIDSIEFYRNAGFIDRA
ncbi:cinnamoyl-CoA reductase 1-like [Zingiber officinale]|uniref:cinnamoyl-CoA reductase 1-like n=1 Tax=Zingiber officinale TaxID=94328 RepID=UPI001C4CE31E|nr:cinnamoyl-CoA reductase 1-like [Zingiber officinale]